MKQMVLADQAQGPQGREDELDALRQQLAKLQVRICPV